MYSSSMDIEAARTERRAVSVGGIAALLGVSPNTVKAWIKRGPGMKDKEALPQPVDEVSPQGPVYWWSDDVIAWARRTGRPLPWEQAS